MRCATESRRLIERGSVGRSVDIDKLDSCSEVTLGLCSTLLVTLAIWAIAVPLFDLGGIPWIKSWEGPDSSKSRSLPITMADFKQAMGSVYATPVDAFAAIDADHDQRANFTEFAEGLRTFRPPLNETQAIYAFGELDIDDSNLIESDEFLDSFRFAEFGEAASPLTVSSSTSSQTTAPTTSTVATPQQETADAKMTNETTTVMTTTVRSSTLAAVATSEMTQTAATTIGEASTTSLAASTSTAITEATSEITATTVEAISTFTAATTTMPATTATAATTTTASDKLVPLTMLDFISRMGRTHSDLPHDSFAELDTDEDKFIRREEFIAASKLFRRPLNVEEGPEVFNHLDQTGDDVVDIHEFFQAWTAGHFLEQGSAGPVSMTLGEYLARMEHVSEIASVELDIPGLDFKRFTLEQREVVSQVIVRELSFAGGVKRAAVKDLKDVAARVTLSAWQELEAQAVGRRLAVVGLTARARIEIPPGDVSNIIVESLAGAATKKAVADRLAQVPGLPGQMSQDDILIAVTKLHTHVWERLDSDHDGFLNFREFAAATEKFVPPLSKDEAEFCFKGLDGGGDGRLSALEFAAYGMAKFFDHLKVPEAETLRTVPTVPAAEQLAKLPAEPGKSHAEAGQQLDGTPMEMQSFKDRMGSIEPEIAFSALDSDGDSNLQQTELAQGAGDFSPPLTHGEVEFVFAGLDTNKDGKISTQEFVTTLNSGHFSEGGTPAGPARILKGEEQISQRRFLHQMNAAFESPEQAFTACDGNGNGRATLDEFLQCTRKFFPPLTQREAEWAFGVLDANHNQRLEAAEFLAAVTVPAAVQEVQPVTPPPSLLPQEPTLEGNFRARAHEWAGSMARSCSKLGLLGDATISKGVFAGRIAIFEPLISEDLAQEIFFKLDSNSDNRLSASECCITLDQFKKALQDAGSVDQQLIDVDVDFDGRLSGSEFVHLASSLFPTASNAKVVALARDLDTNQNGFVDPLELPVAFRIVGRAPKRHPGEVLTPVELEPYHGVPAVIEGRADVSLREGQGEAWPSEEEVSKEVGHLFRAALEQLLGIRVNIASVATVQDQVAMEGRPGSEFARTTHLLWTADAVNGGALLALLSSRSCALGQAVQAQFGEAALNWMRKLTTKLRWQVAFNFFGRAAATLPAGRKLEVTVSWDLAGPADTPANIIVA